MVEGAAGADADGVRLPHLGVAAVHLPGVAPGLSTPPPPARPSATKTKTTKPKRREKMLQKGVEGHCKRHILNTSPTLVQPSKGRWMWLQWPRGSALSCKRLAAAMWRNWLTPAGGTPSPMRHNGKQRYLKKMCIDIQNPGGLIFIRGLWCERRPVLCAFQKPCLAS